MVDFSSRGAAGADGKLDPPEDTEMRILKLALRTALNHCPQP